MLDREASTTKETVVGSGEISVRFTTNENPIPRVRGIRLSCLSPAKPMKLVKKEQGQIVVFEGPLTGTVLNVRQLVRMDSRRGSPIVSVKAFHPGNPGTLLDVLTAQSTRVEDFDS